MDLENFQEPMMQVNAMLENKELKARLYDLQAENNHLKNELQFQYERNNAMLKEAENTAQYRVGQVVLVCITDIWRLGVIEEIIDEHEKPDAIGGKIRYAVGGMFDYPIQVTGESLRPIKNEPNICGRNIIKDVASALEIYQSDSYLRSEND